MNGKAVEALENLNILHRWISKPYNMKLSFSLCKIRFILDLLLRYKFNFESIISNKEASTALSFAS